MRQSNGYSGLVGIGFTEADEPTEILFTGPTLSAEQKAASPGLSTGTMTLIQAQTALEALGFDLGPSGADGIPGPKTTQAVRDFQASQGLTVDGIIGPQTSQALRDALEGASGPIIELDDPPFSAGPASEPFQGPDNFIPSIEKQSTANVSVPATAARGGMLLAASLFGIAVFAGGFYLLTRKPARGRGRGRARHAHG